MRITRSFWLSAKTQAGGDHAPDIDHEATYQPDWHKNQDQGSA